MIVTDKFLILFSENHNADLGEKIGNFGLGLLRIGFGKSLTVEKISNLSEELSFNEKTYSKIVKFIAVFAFFIMLPLTGLLAVIGIIGIVCSKSHKQIFNLYSPGVKESKAEFSSTDKVTPDPNLQNLPAPNLPPEKAAPLPPSESARKFQKCWANYRTHKINSFALSKNYIDEADQIIQLNKLKTLPNPTCGASKRDIFLGENFVIRQKAIWRIETMNKIQMFLSLKNYDHLRVPKAAILGEYLVEERANFPDDLQAQVYLYAENIEAFTPAIKQFIKFYLQVNCPDLGEWSGKFHFGGGWHRYDNLPLAIENGVGKIWLLDLDSYQIYSDKDLERTKRKALSCIDNCFPYHNHVIVEALTELFPEDEAGPIIFAVENHMKYLENQGQYGLTAKMQFCNKLYNNYLNYVQSNYKDVDYHTIHASDRLDSEKETGWIKDNRDLVIAVILNYLSQKIQEKAENKTPESNTNLLLCRTICIQNSDIESLKELILKLEINATTEDIEKIIKKCIQRYYLLEPQNPKNKEGILFDLML